VASDPADRLARLERLLAELRPMVLDVAVLLDGEPGAASSVRKFREVVGAVDRARQFMLHPEWKRRREPRARRNG
jgi:hypothetical protein